MIVKLFNYLLISNIFTGVFILFRKPFDFYMAYAFMILFLLFYLLVRGKFEVNRSFVIALFLVSAPSLVNIIFKNNLLSLFLKQFMGFIFNAGIYYLLIKINKGNVDRLFRIYLRFAVIIAAIGIIQEISFLTGFRYGYDYSYLSHSLRFCGTTCGLLRVTSLLAEPSAFAGAMTPAIFVSVQNIINKNSSFINRSASILIIISTMVSFSILAYVSIVVAFILVAFNSQKVSTVAVWGTILVLFMVLSYIFIPEIRYRIDDTAAIIARRARFGQGNLSTFSFCSNGAVAFKNFIHNPLFGAGLGSHPISYNKYISQFLSPDIPAGYQIPLNTMDAGSLFFRLISETGLFGVALFFYFIIKFYVSRKKDSHFWIISNSIACLFALNLIRNGNYFYFGFILFVWMYYFAHRNAVLKQ